MDKATTTTSNGDGQRTVESKWKLRKKDFKGNLPELARRAKNIQTATLNFKKLEASQWMIKVHA